MPNALARAISVASIRWLAGADFDSRTGAARRVASLSGLASRARHHVREVRAPNAVIDSARFALRATKKTHIEREIRDAGDAHPQDRPTRARCVRARDALRLRDAERRAEG